MQRTKLLLISVSILLLACACGQKGPLYLPEAERPAVENTPEPESGQEEEKDRDRDETPA